MLIFRWLNITALIAVCVFATGCQAADNAQPDADTQPSLAFDGALGFGRFTQGGRGGKVLIVNTLDDPVDAGPGTFRWAVDQEFPRIVRFAVSGVIKLHRPLIIDEDFLTIEGQSSPGGIVISGAQTRISANQVIVRYMRFRPGSGEEDGDALTATKQHNIIIDHCSLSWANDEVASFYNNTDFTLQYSIVSESLNHAGHKKGDHGYGAIWGGRRASFLRNVLAHHTSRNPRVNGYRLGAPFAQNEVLADIRSNVIYNWSENSAYGGEQGRFNLVDNVYRRGPAKGPARFFQLDYRDGVLQEGEAYIAGNVMWHDPDMSRNNTLGVNIKRGKRLTSGQRSRLLSQFLRSNAFSTDDTEAMPELSARDSWALLIEQQQVGANLPIQDSVDRRILGEIHEGTSSAGNGIINHENQVINSWQQYASEFEVKDE